LLFSGFSLDFAALGFVFGDGLGDAFAKGIFFGVGFGIGFGVVFALGVGVAVSFGAGVDFGVGDGNSISLLAVTAGLSCSASSCFDGFASSRGLACFADGEGWFSDSPAARSSAPPNHTTLSGLDEALAARLQRIRTPISARCARAIRTTFRQKRRLAAP
jgi:hypothetical protein